MLSKDGLKSRTGFGRCFRTSHALSKIIAVGIVAHCSNPSTPASEFKASLGLQSKTLLFKKIKIAHSFIILINYVCVYITCRGQRTTCGNPVFTSTIWVGIEFRLLGLAAAAFT